MQAFDMMAAPEGMKGTAAKALMRKASLLTHVVAGSEFVSHSQNQLASSGWWLLDAQLVYFFQFYGCPKVTPERPAGKPFSINFSNFSTA